MTDIHTTAKGVTIYVDTNYDISSATTLEIHFSAPSGGNSFVNSVSTSASSSASPGIVLGIFYKSTIKNPVIGKRVNIADYTGQHVTIRDMLAARVRFRE